jgi:DNA-binding LytR/AlgR family response regulator
MKVLIIEDEKLAAEKLIQLLKETSEGIQVISVLESVEETVNWLISNPLPDLIFMDIQLDDGISFEIFDSIKIEVPVIFTTAYNDYAIRAFKVNSVDYLLKPIEKEALKTALRKYEKHFAATGSNFEEKIARVIGQISKTYKSRFFIKIGLHFKSVAIEEICCFFVEEGNTFLKTRDNKTYDLDYSLDQLQTMIDPGLFFRINRSFLVSINAIDEIISYSTTRLKLKLKNSTAQDLIVSRDKVTAFKNWMDR